VAIRDSFAVTAVVISDSSGNIIMAATQRLHSTDILVGEVSAALLTSQLALSLGYDHFIIEGDALLVILAINSPELFSLWNFSNVVSDINLSLSSFQSWNALKVSRCANYRAHALDKWAASRLVIGSISIRSPILSSIQIQSGKDHHL
jgi:hypothetical protein